MSFYEEKIVPHIINCACGTKPILKQREKVVPLASGTVLEIGIGTGINLAYYNASIVDKVIGLDPSEASWKLASKRAANLHFDVEFIALPGENIPLDDDSIDTVLLTYSLCTIPDPITALEGMRRVLKPNGKLIFCEHGQAPDANVCKWQNRINSSWKVLFGGCNVNRNIPQLLHLGGFTIDSINSMYLPATPKFAGFNYWGIAS
jgi:ubiquinone/menaquinone biosynthesis C-methylase UbiE